MPRTIEKCLTQLLQAVRERLIFEHQVEQALTTWLAQPEWSMEQVLLSLKLIESPSELPSLTEFSSGWSTSAKRDSEPSATQRPTQLAPNRYEGDVPFSPRLDLNPSAVETTLLPDLSERFLLGPELGAGGTGRVFAATDMAFERPVAIKIFETGAGSQELSWKYFWHEARITASLQHAFIPSVYAVGQLQGKPGFAMELLSGRNLKSHIDGTAKVGNSSHTMRTLLVQALEMTCRAVEKAHECQIIHRDIKPANIFWADDGTIKLGDWGHAGYFCFPEPLSEAAAADWVMHSPHGTPAYIAPERLADRRIATPQVDVYSLGVTLYVALTGVEPSLHTATPNWEKVLKEKSRRVPGQLARIPRALQAICEKALARDPRERYPSAAELRKDLERWRNGEAISVYDPWLVRSQRVIRKNYRALFVVASILAVTVMGIWQERNRTASARDSAVAAQRSAESWATLSLRAIGDLLQETTRGPDSLASLPNSQGVRKRLLDKSRELLDELKKMRTDEGPSVLYALAQQQLASLLLEMGELPAAQQQLGEVRQRWQSELRRDPDNRDLQLDWASLHHLQAEWEITQGDFAAARQSVESALAIRERLELLPGTDAWESQAASQVLLGSVLRKQGELAAAEFHLTSLKRTWENLDPNFNTLSVQQLRANSLQILGAVVAQAGRWDEASELFQECVAVQQMVAEAVPWNPQLKYELAITIYDLGRMQIDRRRPAEALPWLQRAEPLLEQLDRENPQQMKFLVAYATNLNTTAICATLVGQRDLAGRALERLFQVLAAKPTAIWDTNLELVLVHSRAALVRVHWLTEEKRTSEIPAILSQAREVVERFTASVKPTPELTDLMAKIQAAEQAASSSGERRP